MELPSALSETLIKRGAIFHSNADRFRKKIGHSKFFVVMGVSQGACRGLLLYQFKYQLHSGEQASSIRIAI